MIVQNLNNGTLLIKHETAVDPDNDFVHYEGLSEEDLLFDRFFKDALANKSIYLQIAEIVDINIAFSTYFAPMKNWEDGKSWKKWFKNFQNSHKMFLYFYQDDAQSTNVFNRENDRRAKELFTGTIDTTSSIKPTFNSSTSQQELFEVKDYLLFEDAATSSVQMHVNTDVIYNCLKRSEIPECKNILKTFQYELLNKTIQSKTESKVHKTKI